MKQRVEVVLRQYIINDELGNENRKKKNNVEKPCKAYVYNWRFDAGHCYFPRPISTHQYLGQNKLINSSCVYMH